MLFNRGEKCQTPRQYFLSLFFAMTLLFQGTAHGGADPLTSEERRWLNANHDSIRINHVSDWPPILFSDEHGHPRGIAFDYSRLLEKKLGFRFERVPAESWSDVLVKFKNREIDVVCDITQTLGRTKFASFTKPYLEIPSVIIVSSTNQSDLSLSKMKGMKIAVIADDTAHDFMLEKYAFLDILPRKNEEECLLDVSTGVVDAAVVSIATSSYIYNKTKISNLRIAGYTGHKYYLSFASRNDLPILHSILEKGLALVTMEEENAIYKRWIHLGVDPFYKNEKFWFVLLGGTVFIAGIISAILIWNRKLQKEVEKRTTSLAAQTKALKKEVLIRKKAQKELKERETHLRTVLESIPDLIWLKDLDGVYRSCNSEFGRCYGSEEAEIIGRTDYDFVEKAEADIFIENDRFVLEKEVPLIIDEEVTCPGENRRRQLESIKIPMYDPDGTLSGVLGIGRDVTKRKAAEQALARNRDRLESILSNIQGLTYRCKPDKDWTMLFMSSHVESITGYPASDFIENSVRTFESVIHREDTKTVSDKIQQAIAASEPWELEYRVQHKNGSMFWVFEKGAAVFDEKGGGAYLDGFIINITRQKVMEEHFRQAQKLEAIGALAGGIAHDFNNILGGILGFSELLKKDLASLGLPEQIQKRNENILKAGIRAKELVTQILAFSRSETGKTGPVVVAEVVNDGVKLLRATLPSTIEIKIHCQSNRTVMGDIAKIHQVVMNLCTNAGHAMKTTGGYLTVTVDDVKVSAESCEGKENVNPGDFICLSVEDTGHGMDPETCEKIMDPFFTTKPKGEGTGMGLWVVQGIIKGMRGYIEVSSKPRLGTRFDVYLPAFTKTVQQSDEGEKTVSDHPRGNGHILFVDDEKTLTQLAGEVLSRLGYEVTCFNSATKALESFKTDPGAFDMVITDLTMPEMTGDRLCSHIRAVRSDIPVILATGILEEREILDEFDAVMEKPVQISDMANAIQRVFNGRS